MEDMVELHLYRQIHLFSGKCFVFVLIVCNYPGGWYTCLLLILKLLIRARRRMMCETMYSIRLPLETVQ